MAIFNLNGPDAWVQRIFAGRVPSCFFCGEPAGPVVILWSGCAHGNAGDGLVVLHVECCHKLCSRLTADAVHAERLLCGKEPLAGIDSSLLAKGTA